MNLAAITSQSRHNVGTIVGTLTLCLYFTACTGSVQVVDSIATPPIAIDTTQPLATYSFPDSAAFIAEILKRYCKGETSGTQDGTDWTVATATPTVYYLQKVPTGNSLQMGFYPKPSTTSVNSVLVYFAEQPDTLSADSDEPFNGRDEFTAYHDLLVDYAAGIYVEAAPVTARAASSARYAFVAMISIVSP